MFLEKPNPQKPKRTPSKELYKLKDWLIVGEEGRKKGYLNQDAFLSAYASFFLPLYLPEVFEVFQNHFEIRKIQPRPVIRLLDVGAGLGTATLSYLLWCHHNKLPLPQEITLLDQSRKALAQAVKFIKVLAPDTRVNCERLDLRNTVEMNRFYRHYTRHFDLTLIAHTLSELGNGPRMRPQKMELLEKFLNHTCHDEGDLLMIESDHRGPIMDMMAMRDEFYQNDAQIIGPCPRGTEFCPMLKARAGTCYASIPRKIHPQLVPWDKEMMRFLGIEMDSSSFAYLWIKPNPVEKLMSTPKHRVLITDPRSKRLLLCDGQTLLKGSNNLSTSYRGALIMDAIPVESKPPIKPSVK